MSRRGWKIRVPVSHSGTYKRVTLRKTLGFSRIHTAFTAQFQRMGLFVACSFNCFAPNRGHHLRLSVPVSLRSASRRDLVLLGKMLFTRFQN
jgi:hypothetical protein